MDTITPFFQDFQDRRGRIWEWFIDTCYYEMTCVRVKGETDFNSQLSFHFNTSQQASEFVEMLKMSY